MPGGTLTPSVLLARHRAITRAWCDVPGAWRPVSFVAMHTVRARAGRGKKSWIRFHSSFRDDKGLRMAFIDIDGPRGPERRKYVSAFHRAGYMTFVDDDSVLGQKKLTPRSLETD